MGEVITSRRDRKTLSIRYYVNGKRIERSAHTTKEKEALALLKIREGEAAKGLPVAAKTGRLRFDEAAADVVNDYRVNGRKTLTHVERRIRMHLAPYFGTRRMSTISTADVRAFIVKRQADLRIVARAKTVRLPTGGTREVAAVTQPYANAEINRELAILKRAFTLAIEVGALFQKPVIHMLKERAPRPDFFERDQFDAVVARLQSPVREVVTFAYLTGWRHKSEILPLEWRQVDMRAGTVRLDPGQAKNDEGRLFPFDALPELRAIMEALYAARLPFCPYVFHRDGVQVKDYRAAWDTAVRAAGWPGKVPHDFRRTAVRNLTRAGVPEKVAQQLTGHKTREVFDRYDIVNEADLRAAVRRLAAVPQAPSGVARGRVLQVGTRRGRGAKVEGA